MVDGRLVLTCPTCGKPVDRSADSPYKPFCSRRCKLIDLGEWMDEGHRIPGEPAEVWPDDEHSISKDH